MCVLQVCTGVYTPAPPWSCSAGSYVERSRTPRCFNRLAEPSAQLSEAISFFGRAIRTVTSVVDVPTLDALQILCQEDGPEQHGFEPLARRVLRSTVAMFEILEIQKIVESKARIILIPEKGGILPELLVSSSRSPESSAPFRPMGKAAAQT
jgi:hypothetical protein